MNKLFVLNEDTAKIEDKIIIQKDGITLYESAYNKLKELLQNSNKFFRISLVAAGCAGVSYTAQFDKPTPQDVIVELGDSIRILVDTTPRFPSQSTPDKYYSDWDFLHGLHLKYEESIMSSQFVMDNPNASRGCSCGISFKPFDYGGKPKSCHGE